MKAERTPENVLVPVVYDVLRGGTFDTIADLVDAVKERAARYRIPYDSGAVTDAIAVVSRSRPVVRQAPRPTNPRHVEREQPPDPLAADPRGIFNTVITRLRAGNPIHPMPPAAPLDGLTARERDHQLALEMTAKEIQASIDRCVELERLTKC